MTTTALNPPIAVLIIVMVASTAQTTGVNSRIQPEQGDQHLARSCIHDHRHPQRPQRKKQQRAERADGAAQLQVENLIGDW